MVIGGGAAGCMAALAAAERGAAVTLLERNPKLGRKLYITGKGRCNVTNDCSPREVLEHVPRNGRFLTSAVTRFPPEAVKAFLSARACPSRPSGATGYSRSRTGPPTSSTPCSVPCAGRGCPSSRTGPCPSAGRGRRCWAWRGKRPFIPAGRPLWQPGECPTP